MTEVVVSLAALQLPENGPLIMASVVMMVQSISEQQKDNSSLECITWLCDRFSNKVHSRTVKLLLLFF